MVRELVHDKGENQGRTALMVAASVLVDTIGFAAGARGGKFE